MSSNTIANLLKDMEHGDQDNREMAATDMCTEILKGVKLDSTLEMSVCQAYIKQLEDTSVNVRGNAVKCISKIGSKISEAQFGMVANKLTQCVVTGPEEFRDIYSTCLKTLISEADKDFGKTLCECLLGPLVEGTGHISDPVREQCIEITNDLLKRFNEVLANHPKMINKELLMGNLIKQLSSPSAAIRKRACSCFGSLAVTLDTKQLSVLISLLLKNINPKNKAGSYAFVETLGAVAGTVGYKLAPNLDAMMSALRDFAKVKDASDTTPAEIDHGIKEVCLTVYDFSIRKCPKEASAHLDEILETTIGLMSYDPNYNPDVMMSGAAEEDMAAWGAEPEELHATEDDSSWKVRKAAAKLLATIVRYRNDKVKPMYEKVISVLVSRLNEKEESIMCEILNIFTDMIKGIVIGDAKAAEDTEMSMLLTRKSSAEFLLKGLPDAIKHIMEHFNDKSLAVRESIVILLYNLSIAAPDYMNGTLLGVFLPQVFTAFKESSSTVKIIIMQTLRRLIRTSLSEDAYIAYLGQMLNIFKIAMKEEYYKLPAEAMRTSGTLIRLLRRTPEMSSPEATDAVKQIYGMCGAVFKMSDVDPEIKQSVIYVMGIVLAYASDILDSKQVDEILATMQDRLKNDALRFQVMKSYHTILGSPKQLPIEGRLQTLMGDFLQMAHKVARPVKLAALDTLLEACNKYSAVCLKSANNIVAEVTSLLKEGDLHVLQTTLKIVNKLAAACSEKVLEDLLQAMLPLCKTTLINSFLDDVIAIMEVLAGQGKGNLSPEAISEVLAKECVEKNIRPVAAVVAHVVMLKEAEIPKMLDVYTKLLKSKADIMQRKLACMIIGNIGQKKDLSKYAELNALLGEQLKMAEEEMKINVAICLGNIALGNKAYYIPMIMGNFKSQSEIAYLMLIALREIVVLDHEGIMKCLEDLLPALKVQADTDDEGHRTLIAEIVGKLLQVSPSTLVPHVEASLEDKAANVRATYALSYKYWYGRSKAEIPEFILSMGKLLNLLKDPDPKSQKGLLDSLTHVAHINAVALRVNAARIFNGVLPMTVLRTELIREVDLGPLKHRIDDGEPVRKGAYILLDNMLTELNDKMDIPAIVDRLVYGLADESDEVQNACQQILTKLCEISPGSILGPLEKLLEQTTKAIKRLQEKIKKKQDVDRSTDNIRGFLRVLIAMNHLPEIDLNSKYLECKKDLLKDKTVQSIYDELNKIVE